jgi:hypothetical protein
VNAFPADAPHAPGRVPSPVRTLDALHLASIEFLRAQQVEVELASYDQRQIGVARRLSIAIADV